MLESKMTSESQDGESHHNTVKTLKENAVKRPTVGLGVVVWKDEKVLLVRRGKAPRRNQWSIPGGSQEFGETVRNGAIREVKEETGVDIKLIGLIDVVDGIFKDDGGNVETHYTLVDFAAHWTSGDALASDDASEVRWATLGEVDELVDWEETRRVISRSADLVNKR